MKFLRASILLLTGYSLAAAASVIGSVRVPGSGLEVNLATQVGRPFDMSDVERDVRYLWSLGRFEDIRVETSAAADDRISVVFVAAPKQWFTIRDVSLEPNPLGLESPLPKGFRTDREGLHEAAAKVRKALEERGYANAKVTYELIPAKGGESDLRLTLDPGDAVRVGSVEFTGATGLPAAELESSLRALRPTRILPGLPGIWGGWRLRPSYTRSAVEGDVIRLRSHYFLKGYPDADVSAGEAVSGPGGERITIHADSGPRREPLPKNFCPALFAERLAAQREGVLEFTASASVDDSGRVTVRTEKGASFRTGRIQFSGNRHFSDAFLRRHFLLDEAAPFDERLLRLSMERLNRTGLFEKIDERNVAIFRRGDGSADIRVHLNERKRGAWNLSGPVGPIRIGGPIQGSIGARLPAWGRGVLELSTYTASLSVFALGRPLFPILAAAGYRSWTPVLSLRRPYTPGEGWRSGFALAPQLGWRLMAAGYVATQLEQRLLPVLRGERGLEPELAVTVHRASGDTAIVCEPPAPRLSAVRNAAAMTIGLLGAFSGL